MCSERQNDFHVCSNQKRENCQACRSVHQTGPKSSHGTHQNSYTHTRRTRSQSEKKLILSQKLFYEYGIKSGHVLAKALCSKKARNTIHQIHSPTGKTLTKNTDIAHEFEQYYSSLYNLNVSNPSASPTSKRQNEIQSFLNKFSPGKNPSRYHWHTWVSGHPNRMGTSSKTTKTWQESRPRWATRGILQNFCRDTTVPLSKCL